MRSESRAKLAAAVTRWDDDSLSHSLFLSLFSRSLSSLIKQPTFETAGRSYVHSKLQEQIKWRKYSEGGNSSAGSDSGPIRSFVVGSAAFFSFFSFFQIVSASG